MKKIHIITIIAIGFAYSCSNPLKEQFETLDRALEMRPVYEMEFKQKKDSLQYVLKTATSDSIKWEVAYNLHSMTIYNNLDTSLYYINTMMELCHGDSELRSITQRCHVNYLWRKDYLDSAYAVFTKIDPTPLSKDELNLYYDAGYRLLDDLVPQLTEHLEKQNEIMQAWKICDSTYYRYIHYCNQSITQTNRLKETIAKLKASNMKSLNDSAKVNDLIASVYLRHGDVTNAKKHYAIAAEYDIRLSAKTYNALYMLAQQLFKDGDIERANQYMKITRTDALASNYSSRYQKVFMMELEIMNSLLQEQRRKKAAYLYAISVTLMLLIFVSSMLILLHKYSYRLKISLENLSVLSRIKDSFLATYMERCVDYLNKVDQYRSSLRKTFKAEGAEAVVMLLKQPSFADKEFKTILTDFDAAFLGIFPDFVEKVNEHMQPEYRLTVPSQGELSTELRILALIRMGITKRQKIAKVLNMSVNTVYSYHCNLQKHSLHPDSSFDEIIENL